MCTENVTMCGVNIYIKHKGFNTFVKYTSHSLFQPFLKNNKMICKCTENNLLENIDKLISEDCYYFIYIFVNP